MYVNFVVSMTTATKMMETMITLFCVILVVVLYERSQSYRDGASKGPPVKGNKNFFLSE